MEHWNHLDWNICGPGWKIRRNKEDITMEDRREIRHERHALETVVPLKVPYRMDIEIFYGCNFKCNFCPLNNADAAKSKKSQMMSFDTFKEIIDQIADMEREAGGEQVKVIYLGGLGESLLHKDFPEMVSYVKEKKVCREIRTITNGSMLNPVLNQKIVDSGLDLLRISVEALSGEKYKEICGFDLNFNKFVGNVSDIFQRSKKSGGGVEGFC